MRRLRRLLKDDVNSHKSGSAADSVFKIFAAMVTVTSLYAGHALVARSWPPHFFFVVGIRFFVYVASFCYSSDSRLVGCQENKVDHVMEVRLGA